MLDSNIKRFFISPEASIREAIRVIDRTARGMALVMNGKGRLVLTLTDGDIRRAMLAGLSLDADIRALIATRVNKRYPVPITRPMGTLDSELLSVMNERSLRHIPLLDKKGKVIDIVFLSDLVKEYELPLKAVVMAGGFGKRLRPLTKSIPKPMLPIGGRPLLERTIEQLQRSGIRQVNLSTHYKGKLIEKHFRDGRKFGVGIKYVQEDRPLGTAGALSLVNSNDPILVINGDILTNVDFRAMLSFHREHNADLTVAVKQYEFRVPYGVVECQDVQITRISEKPLIQKFINAGIYLVGSKARRQIPKGVRSDMPDLIALLLKKKLKVISFPIREYWLDIGHRSDYVRAKKDVKRKNI
jgi:dTDP-glucose pyrophosphorylase/CBS domain-containing protein